MYRQPYIQYLEAFWVTDSNKTFVQGVHEEFKERLGSVYSLEDWLHWSEGVLSKAVAKYDDKSYEEQIEANKNFLLQWNYFTDTILCHVRTY